MSFDTVGGAYVSPYVLVKGADSLEVKVTGSISGTYTGLVLSGATPSGELDYYTVSYTDLGSLYLSQIVFEGGKASQPAAPYHRGYTFIGWKTTGNADYDFDAPITARTELHAGFDAPSVSIGGYVKTDADGTVNGKGAYYRMANLAIMGYPAAGAPMNMATLYVTNGEVTFTERKGYTIHENIDSATGNGSVSIMYGGIPVAEAQSFLRENVIVRVKNTAAEHRMQVSVYGGTTQGAA
jgi:hypothetical protein